MTLTIDNATLRENLVFLLNNNNNNNDDEILQTFYVINVIILDVTPFIIEKIYLLFKIFFPFSFECFLSVAASK